MKKNIILGVTGSIAAYKAADIANTLTKEGHSVHVIMTKAGMEFITPLTMQTLTKNKVHTDQFAPYVPSEVEHISLAQKADLFLVAPASADFIAKAAAGIADDMLTTVLLATRNVPILIAPAMNTAMYENPHPDSTYFLHKEAVHRQTDYPHKTYALAILIHSLSKAVSGK